MLEVHPFSTKFVEWREIGHFLNVVENQFGYSILVGAKRHIWPSIHQCILIYMKWFYTSNWYEVTCGVVIYAKVVLMSY